MKVSDGLFGKWKKKDNAETHYLAGVDCEKKELYKEAEEEYLKAIELDPDYYKAYSSLGSICLRQRRGEEALKYYEKALEINPNDSITHFNLGIRYYLISQDDSAFEHLSDAIIADPGIEMKVYNKIREIGYHQDFNKIYELVNEKLRKMYLRNGIG